MAPELPGRSGSAELVAALSLGIDLGFGQPMEHVLRQCLIALRLAERVGLDEQTRAAVYYTALLVNVGCHTDAHEQAKWFGDDIALKADKYDLRAARRAQTAADRDAAARLRAAAAAPVPASGSSSRVSGHREVDDMIAHHAEHGALARRGARAAGRRARRARRGLRAVGRQGLAGRARRARTCRSRRASRRSPSSSRSPTASAASTAATDAGARARAASSSTRTLARAASTPTPSRSSPTSTRSTTWDAVIDAEPALAVRAVRRPVRRGAAGDRELRRPQVALLPRPRAGRRRPRRRGRPRLGLPATTRCATLRRAGLVHGFGRLGVSNAIWDKRGPLGAGEWERVRMHPVPDRAHAAPVARRSRRSARIAVQHRERLDGSGYPRGLVGRRDLARRRACSAPPTPTRRCASRGRTASRCPPTAAAAELRAEVQAGRLDARRRRGRARRRRPPRRATPRRARPG